MQYITEIDRLNELYRTLFEENQKLKKEIEKLKSILNEGIENINLELDLPKNQNDKIRKASPPDSQGIISFISKNSTSDEKIELFISLFKGRNDVYAKRWENKSKGTSGYSPVCESEWVAGICLKPKIKCSVCKHRNYIEIEKKTIENHLKGNFVIGIYPLLIDETCWFLAIDFDNEGWEKDISALRLICFKNNIPVAIEKSRSGNGGHAWFFFLAPVPASLARKFGSSMLTSAMNTRHEIKFNSYDRFFPNQDTMPKGGFGNLIALPLQKEARKLGNSVFINNNLEPYPDQWEFLSCVQKINEKEIEEYIQRLTNGNELGILCHDEDNFPGHFDMKSERLTHTDYPEKIEIIKSNMLFIRKEKFSSKALNQIKRLAAFRNPEFYKSQALRMSTFNKPRIISCSEENETFIGIPRGCEQRLFNVIIESKKHFQIEDRTFGGRKINVQFNGQLREEQSIALSNLLEHENGILCGTTAFGKTITAIKLIAEKKLNTLILVDKINLLHQWEKKISEFLIFDNFNLPDIEIDKKRNKCQIGQIGGGKNTISGIIDIAVMQSLNRLGEVKDLVKDYGLVIVDECHHVSAFSFEAILKTVRAKFVYGLTATPPGKMGIIL